jgi:SpoVK/Ycf46/Vps4 family AAA+-type ATPase
MASAEQVKALLKSYSEGNGEHFVSVALQIAADVARTGKGKLAQQLRDLVDEIKRKQSSGKVGGAVPIARPTGELAGLLSVTYPKIRLPEMVLGEETREPLERTIHEFRQQETLREHGLSARRKLLLIGPPGCGKTMTASALAGELKLPLFSVQLHGLITKFMGETAAKLHMIFEAMTLTPGVYFFDEFDAIGTDRGAKNDVGEIRRVLNSCSFSSRTIRTALFSRRPTMSRCSTKHFSDGLMTSSNTRAHLAGKLISSYRTDCSASW